MVVSMPGCKAARVHRSSEADPALAATVRRLRKLRNESQETAAHRAGLTTATWARVESGRASPAWATVKRIAEALDLTIAELAGEVEREP
jgi:transcriptional regulator with XRE-family HTH domain